MSLSYVQKERTAVHSKIFSDPYMRVKIEQIDHSKTIRQDIVSWSRSRTCEVSMYDSWHYVRIPVNSAYASVDLTSTITLPEDGWYRIWVRIVRSPYNKDKKATLYIDNTQTGEAYDAFYDNSHWKLVDWGKYYLSSGARAFKLTLDKGVAASEIIIWRVNDHTSNNMTNYAKKLDIQSLEYTQNSVNEPNSLTMPIILKDEYYDDDVNSPSRFVFDGRTNAITLWMGENERNSRAMFGGYIQGLEDDGNILTIKAADRLWDFDRETLFLNMAVNTTVSSDSQPKFKYVNKPTIVDAVKFLAENNEIGINTSGVTSPWAFSWNFGTIGQFNAISCTGYTKVWDKRSGNPAPSLRLGYGKATGNSYLTLFNDVSAPYNAAEFNLISFDYLYSTRSAKYPTKMNMQIDMYREGQTIADVVTYNVPFNAGYTTSNIIGNFSPVYNGKWNTAKIDIREKFDEIVPSSAYYVTRVALANTISASQVANRTNSAIWLDNIKGYGDAINLKATIDMEGKYALDFLKKICEDCEHSLYVDYGDERRKDILVLKSDYDEVAPIAVLPNNVIQIGKVTYDLKDGNVRNIVRRMFHHTVNKTKVTSVTVKTKPKDNKWVKRWVVGKTKTGTPIYNYMVYKYSTEKVEVNDMSAASSPSSYERYLTLDDFVDMTDTSSEVDANKDADKFLNEHNYAPQVFSVNILGTTQLAPNQYLFIHNDQRRLTGLHKIKSIIHKYNPNPGASNNAKWNTQIDLGAPSKRFRGIMAELRENVGKMNRYDNRTVFTADMLGMLGYTSPGTFVNDQ